MEFIVIRHLLTIISRIERFGVCQRVSESPEKHQMLYFTPVFIMTIKSWSCSQQCHAFGAFVAQRQRICIPQLCMLTPRSYSILLAHAIRHWEGVYGIIRFPECDAPYVTMVQYFQHVVLESTPSAVQRNNLSFIYHYIHLHVKQRWGNI